jgi:hypothetical protein
MNQPRSEWGIAMFRVFVLLAAILGCSIARAQTPGGVQRFPRNDGSGGVETGPFFTFLDDKVYQLGLDASKQGKLLVVAIPADSWPGMKEPNPLDQWKEASVADWLAAHGVAAVYRRDDSPVYRSNTNVVVKRTFNKTPPGLVAIRNGDIIDQTTHFKSADDLLAWLQLALKDDVTLEYARKLAGERTDGGPLLPRLVLAWRLDHAGKNHEADAEYEWVFEQTLRHKLPSGREQFTDPRYPDRYPAGRWQREERAADFAKRNPEAKARLITLRDSFAAQAETETDVHKRREARDDWFRLYHIFPNPDALLKWYKSQPPEPRPKRKFEAMHSLRRTVFHMLTEADRWADAGQLVDKPFGWATEQMMMLSAAEFMSADDTPNEKKQEMLEARVRAASEAGEIYAALLAAGRESSAQALAEVLEEFDEEDENQIIRRGLLLMALDAHQVRPFHAQWADEADKNAAEDKKLKPRVEEALRAKPTP